MNDLDRTNPHVLRRCDHRSMSGANWQRSVRRGSTTAQACSPSYGCSPQPRGQSSWSVDHHRRAHTSFPPTLIISHTPIVAAAAAAATTASQSFSHRGNPALMAAAERRRRVAAEAECRREAESAAAMVDELASTVSELQQLSFEQQLASARSL